MARFVLFHPVFSDQISYLMLSSFFLPSTLISPDSYIIIESKTPLPPEIEVHREGGRWGLRPI